jgi:hypothetical protein
MTKRTFVTVLLLAALHSSGTVLSFAAGNPSPRPAAKMGGGALAASGETPLWSGRKPQGPLKPFVLDMVGTPKKSDGTLDPATTFHDTLEEITWHGHKAMRRIAATTKPGETEFTRWSTIVFDEKTLLPYYTELRLAEGVFARREYDGVHVKETRTAGDFRTLPQPGSKLQTVTTRFDLPEPAFAWAEGVGLPLLLALPLREGFEGSAPVISGSPSAVTPCLAAPCFVARISYRVIGKEKIAGISGKQVLTWKVSVPETRFFFWISCDHPRLEGVTWPRSAGVMTKGQADAVYSMGPIVRK